MTRREFVGVGATAVAALSLEQLLGGCAPRTKPGQAGAAPAAGIGYFAQFGVDEALVRDVLAAALAKGGDYADLFFQHAVSRTINLEDGAVNRAYAAVELGVGVRTVKGDQTGYGYTEDFSREALLGCAGVAAAIAAGPSRASPTAMRFGEPLSQRYPVQVRWEDMPANESVALLSRLNQRAFAADPRIKKVSLGASHSSSVILIATSDGRLVEDAQPMTSMFASCVAEQDGRREQNGYNIAARAGLEQWSPETLERLVREAVRRTTVLFDAVTPPPGEMPVVLAAGSSGILLHEAIGHGMEADFNRKGTSIYADRMGKPIAKPFVSIVDDGTVAHARGAINVDDEGTPGRRTVLVENGVLASYMHDLISAKHYSVEPTGNGRRESYRFPPVPRMRATYMLPGEHKHEEIIASVKRGIYCESFTNGQVQIGAGDFTFYVKNGYLIEEGKLARPIKDVNVIGNGPKALEQVDMVGDNLVIDEGGWTCGKDGQGVPVSQGLPTVRVASMTVGGRS